MKIRNLFVAGLICAVSVYADAPRGTVPRAAAENYPAHGARDGIGIGAVLLSAQQARKAFVSDVERCCRVVEVALYPQKDSRLKVSLDDFVLRVTGTDTAAKPSTADVLAARLQKQATPPSTGHDVVVYPSAGVGYESGGIDPVTGQRQPGGVYTTTGVGVGIGGPPQPPKSGSSNNDRRTMELELGEKGLPEGTASAPVSGYLYFAMPANKDKKATYQLEYVLNGEKVVLQFK